MLEEHEIQKEEEEKRRLINLGKTSVTMVKRKPRSESARGNTPLSCDRTAR